MTKPRKPKKSAMLEIRLPFETKEAFMQRCRSLGLSASEVVRAEIDRFLAQTANAHPQEPSMRIAHIALNLAAKPQTALFAVALAVGAAYMISPARALPDLRAQFNRFDSNRDGALSADEFQAGMAGDDHIVIRTERRELPPGAGAPTPERRIVGPVIVPMRDGAPPRELGARPPEAEMRWIAAHEFGRMDMDGDSNVTLAEFEASHAAMLRASFVTLDSDQDGRIAPAEFVAGAPGGDAAHAAEMIADFDTNRDGGVSWEEFSAGPAARP